MGAGTVVITMGGEGSVLLHAGATLRATYHGHYDLITCMEVLEHVVETREVIERLCRLLAPGGRLVVSVPVEIGAALVVKQAARRIAGWKDLMEG